MRRSISGAVSLLVVALLATETAAAATKAEIARWARTIDDHPDMLHADFTPAVHRLCLAKLEGALAVVHLLDAPLRLTRLHAVRVIECAVRYYYGARPGGSSGFPTGAAWKAFRAALSPKRLDANGPKKGRRAMVRRWRHWLSRRVRRPRAFFPRPRFEEVRPVLDKGEETASSCLRRGQQARIWVVFFTSGKLKSVELPLSLRHTRRGRCIDAALRRTLRIPPFSGRSPGWALNLSR